MDWMELRIETNHEGLEPVSALLSGLGIDGIVIDDETEFEDFLEHNHPYWDYVDEALTRQMAGRSRITFYLEQSEDGLASLAAVREALCALGRQRSDCGALALTEETVRSSDWENNWQQYYHPLKIGRRLLVVPEWERDTAETQGRVTLLLNPGLTFGTGSHATTRLCLTALDELIRGGERVLDLGCGSGILSIAALRLGAARAFACDIDPACETVAAENAALNDIGPDVYTVRTGDVLTDGALRTAMGAEYDLVVANIVADVILALAPCVRPLLRQGGRFLCSGIIDDRAEEVRQGLLAAGWRVLESRDADGWFCFLCG